MSGGEKKRVTVGVDLMKGADLILMDGMSFVYPSYSTFTDFHNRAYNWT